jgi:FKBP-type peptidyl-prolyl cis-trans isomerase FklB
MRRITLAFLTLAFLAVPAQSQSPVTLDLEDERLGYTIGYQVGSDFRRMGTPLDPDRVIDGLRDALERTKPRLTPAEMRNALSEVRDAPSEDAR